ncbi:ATP-binding cassette domain-containing protein [Undibacterium flavidum]|uniref:ABC transporter ATP-binding protein n=1 Tax=Undibacterium flavidum TaxID=2762297 RepID=A0ABR6YBY6_9BURK|nr:ATP-binding cassette domain-containing protein [Undibacterium flavidum]MBC3873804.1 ABC transporter ATP-binding protein [Undibacterium flavidum]
MQSYISGNPYDLSRIISTVLCDAATENWDGAKAGRSVLEAMLVRSSFIAPVDRLLRRELDAHVCKGRYYLIPAQATSVAIERIDAILHAAITWCKSHFDLPLPTITIYLKDDFAAPTYVSFDTPSLALIQIPQNLLHQDDLDRLLWHEIGHCFLRCGIRFLDEGFATWVELSRSNAQFDAHIAHTLIAKSDKHEQFTLSELLATGFTSTLGFEDRVSNVLEREALYPKAALVIDAIVNVIGTDGLARLFQQIRETPEQSLSLVKQAAGDQFHLLSQIVSKQQDDDEKTETLDLQKTRKDVLITRAACDVKTLSQMTEQIYALTVSTNGKLSANTGIQPILLDAYISTRELSHKFSGDIGDKLEKSIDKLVNSLNKGTPDLYSVELLARYSLIKLIDAQNFFDRATLAAKANKLVDAAIAMRADTADALLTRAHLLIHTPIQYGGDPDAGMNILLQIAKRTDEYRTIAISIYQKNFGQSPLLLDTSAPAHETSSTTAIQTSILTSEPPRIAEDAPILFDIQGLSFERNTDFSIEIDSMHVRAGEIFGLIGANGAGKSLLLECCLGLNQFDARSHQVFGQDYAAWNKRLANRRKIGAKLHRLGFDTSYRVSDIVLLARASFGSDDTEVYKLFSIGSLLNKRYAWLSTGQRQRLDLYFAFHQGADLLFLDEPTLGLDDEYSARLFSLMATKTKQGAAIIVVSHNQQVLSMCHRIGVLSQGRMPAVGSASELAEKYLSQYRVEVTHLHDVDAFEHKLQAMHAHLIIKRTDAVIALGDHAFLERFQQSVAIDKINNYQVRQSELSDLYAVASNMTKIQKDTHE